MTEAASPQLLRLMIAKNGELIRRLLTYVPSDPDGEEGQRHRVRVAHVRAETEMLNERLQALVDKPPAPRERRRPWLDAPRSVP